jgi:pSer/pThr/pTyr-binding forkhead associated (FHA) protein
MDPQYRGTIVCPKCRHEGDASAYPAAPLNPPTTASQRNPAEEDSAPTDMPANLSNKRLSRPGILVPIGGDTPAEPRTIVLKKGVNTLGRAPQNSIQLDATDEFISRVHARIEMVVKGDDTFEHLLSDAGSKNGTYHNGDLIEKNETVVLCLNDLVKIGHTTYKFTLE